MAWFSQPRQQAERQVNQVYEASRLERLAASERSHGRARQALDLCRQALDIRRRHVPGTEFHTLAQLGSIQMQLDELDDAERSLQEALAIIKRKYYPEHPLMTPILDDMVRCKLKQGNLADAERFCKEVLAIKHASLLPTDVQTIETERTLADIERRLEKYKEAESILLKALKYVDPSTTGPSEEFYYELALLYQDQGRYDKAEDAYRQALHTFAARSGKNERFAACLKSYASLLRATDRGAQAMRLGRELEELGVGWFEMPTFPEDVDGYVQLAKALDIPIALDSLTSRFEARELIRLGGIDVVQPDVCRAGGITESRRIAELADAFGLAFAPHVSIGSAIHFAATAHIASAMPNTQTSEYWIGDNPMGDCALESPLRLESGYLETPAGPGLGIAIREDVLLNNRG